MGDPPGVTTSVQELFGTLALPNLLQNMPRSCQPGAGTATSMPYPEMPRDTSDPP